MAQQAETLENIMRRKSTVTPTQKSTVRETITLESNSAKVLSFAEGRKAARERNKNRAWLMAAVSSTPYAEIRS